MSPGSNILRGATGSPQRHSQFFEPGSISQWLVAGAFMTPWLIGFFFLTVYPVGATFYYSFTDYSLFGSPQWVGLDNYREILSDPRFILVVRNTAIFGLLIIPLSIVTAVLTALLMNIRGPLTGAYRSIIFAPAILPAAATASLWIWILNPQWGLLNAVLESTGLPTVPWLSDPGWAKISLVIISLWMIGSDMVLYLAKLQEIPRYYYEAADIDGANAWQKTWYVTLPHLTPIMFFQLINATIWTFQYFAIPYIVGNEGKGNPGGSLDFYAIYTFDNAFNYLKMGYASAMAVIMFLFVALITVVMVYSSKYWVRYEN